MREERYQEAMLRARERMQRAQDTNATEYMNRKEEVKYERWYSVLGVDQHCFCV